MLSRVRLAVIAELVSVDWATFSDLRRAIQTTKGNLSAHLAKLVDGGYVAERKRFVRRRPQTRYRLTEAGRAALVQHIQLLQDLIASAAHGSASAQMVMAGDDRRSVSRRVEPVDGGTPDARALIARAWQARYEVLRSPPTDEARSLAVVARVEADLLKACEICEQAGDRKGHSVALGKLGHVAMDRGNPDKARTLFKESVAVARVAGDPLRLAHAVRHLGQMNRRVGRLEEAEGCYEEALALYEETGTTHSLDHANALRPMAILREELGDVEAARHLWSRAAKLYRAVGVEEGVRECETRLSNISAPGGDGVSARGG
ncbi:MAG: transcriptional regulator [Gemmatimonadota bacterium]|nr:transcriptional regulator [Gemmatimonadota bacterium]